jgi:hypothetical protein
VQNGQVLAHDWQSDGPAEKTLTVPPSVNRPVPMTLAIPFADVSISVMRSVP